MRDCIYADNYKIKLLGDISNDDEISVTDAVALAKYLHSGSTLSDSITADLNGDGEVDVFDLGLLKRLLLEPSA